MKLQFKTRTLVVFATLAAVILSYYTSRWRHYDAERLYLAKNQELGVYDSPEGLNPYFAHQPTAEQWYSDRGLRTIVDWPVLWLYGGTVTNRSLCVRFESDNISPHDLSGLHVFEYLEKLSIQNAPLDLSHVDQIIKLDQIENVYAGKSVLSRSAVDALVNHGIEVQHEGLAVDFDSMENYLNFDGVYYPLDVENSSITATHELGQDGVMYRLRLNTLRSPAAPQPPVSLYSFPGIYRVENFGTFEHQKLLVTRDEIYFYDKDIGPSYCCWDGIDLKNVQRLKLNLLSRNGAFVHLKCEFTELGKSNSSTIDTRARFDSVTVVHSGDDKPHFEQARLAAERVLRPFEIAHAHFDESCNGWVFKADFEVDRVVIEASE